MTLEEMMFDLTRRTFFAQSAVSLGSLELLRAETPKKPSPFAGILDKPHHAPKAKRIIYLFLSGGFAMSRFIPAACSPCFASLV